MPPTNQRKQLQAQEAIQQKSPLKATIEKVGNKLIELSKSPSDSPKSSKSSKKGAYESFQQTLQATKREQERLAQASRAKQTPPLAPGFRPKYSWEHCQPGPDSKYQQLLDLRAQRAKDAREVEGLYGTLIDGRATVEQRERVGQIALGGVEAFEACFDAALNGIPSVERTTRRSFEMLEEVLNGPHELIEMILGFCRPIDVLNLWQAGVTEAIEVIASGQKWRRYMGLEEHDGTLHFPLKYASLEFGFNVSVRTLYQDNSASITVRDDCVSVCVSIDKHQNFGRLRNDLGHKEDRMLIMQPPVRNLQFYAQCCNHVLSFSFWPPSSRPTKSITSPNGFKVAHIQEVLALIQHEHRMCALADVLDHDASGYVHPNILAFGCVRVPAEDPTFAGMRLAENERLGIAGGPRLALIRRYVKAKYNGRRYLPQ